MRTYAEEARKAFEEQLREAREELLEKIPHFFVSPGWLKIDPNFDPLRKNPRFQKLVAGN